MDPTIRRFAAADRVAVIDLSVRAWAPVFERLEVSVPPFVYDSFYPQGWESRQRADIAAVLDGDDETWVAAAGDAVVGWMTLRLHPADQMGEIYIIAVDPLRQRRGVASALIEHGVEAVRRSGMQMVMVETGDDPGHAPSRATYERAGFVRWPVARYFRQVHPGAPQREDDAET